MMNWLSLGFRPNRRFRQEVDRSPVDLAEDILRVSGAADVALATGILRTLLDKKFIDLKEASEVCHFVADTIVDVPVPHEISNVQAALWKELSKTFERGQSYA